jgi:hypothetical protein
LRSPAILFFINRGAFKIPGPHVDVINATELARSIHLKDPDTNSSRLIGYIKELLVDLEKPGEPPTPPRPGEYQKHETDVVQEYGDVIREDLTPACLLSVGYVMAAPLSMLFP